MKPFLIILFVGVFSFYGCKKESPDTAPPNVLITFPAHGSNISDITLISVEASDNDGVKEVECYIDGVLLNTDSSSPYSFSWDINNYSSGLHTIYAKAVDVSGNEGQSPLISVNIQLPELGIPSLIKPIDNEYADSTLVNFEWTAVDKAVSYNLQVSTNENFTDLLDDITITETKYSKKYESGLVYHWRVKTNALNNRTSDWSAKRSYATPIYFEPPYGYGRIGLYVTPSNNIIILYSNSTVGLAITTLSSAGIKTDERKFNDYTTLISMYTANEISFDNYDYMFISGSYLGAYPPRYGFLMKLGVDANYPSWNNHYINCNFLANKVLTSGEILVGGYVRIDSEQQMRFYCLNPDGSTKWNKTYPSTGAVLSFEQTTDGNIVVFFSDEIHKYSLSGELIWEIPCPFNPAVTECTSDAGFVFADGSILRRYDSNGNVVSSNAYNNNSSIIPMKIIGTMDKGYLISGGDFATKTNSLGNEIWSKYKSSTNRILYFSYGDEDAFGNYIFSPTSHTLIKYTKDGNITNF
ncbi:MAG: hypothetical protein JXB49_30725 [Bacteroidales bacterium]|nr:hypothetical protein [Bacteroidales bacterium]